MIIFRMMTMMRLTTSRHDTIFGGFFHPLEIDCGVGAPFDMFSTTPEPTTGACRTILKGVYLAVLILAALGV